MANQPPVIADGGYWYAVRATAITVDVYEGTIADDDAGIYDDGTFVETVATGWRADVGDMPHCAWGPISITRGPPAARGDWFLVRTLTPVVVDDAYTVDDYMAQVGWLPDDLPFARLGGV